MNRVKFKLKSSGCFFLASAAILLTSLTSAYNLDRSGTLSFETCAPFDSVFELNYILIDSCTGNPCQIPIGQEVKISGSFTYSGTDMESDVKLKHRPNWLLNYVYTAATVLQNDNEFPSSNQFDFEAVVFVDESLAPLKGTLNWRLYNEEDEKIACYNIPIQLTLCS